MRPLVLSLLLAATMPAVVSAQDLPVVRGTMEFAPVGGVSVPFGDFNLVAEPGYNLGGTFAYYVMPSLAVGAEAAYNSYGLDDDPSDVTSLSIWEFSGNAKYLLLPGLASPYLKGTAGLFRQTVSVEGSESVSTTDFGIGGGLGMQLNLTGTKLGIFGEGVVNMAFTEESETTYYTLRLGLNYRN